MASVADSTSSRSALRQIARAAGTVMVAFVLTQILGLVRTILVYRAFGTSADLDSFNAANRVTEMLFNLMASGALGSAFIPTFTGLLAREQRQTAWKLASAVANLLLVLLTLIAALVFIFAPQVVRQGLFILAPEMTIGQEQTTVALLRWLLPTVILFGLSGLVMGILNAHQKFWLPAIAPAMYSLGQIGGVLLLPAQWGIYRLAAGALIGSALHLTVQLPQLLRLNGRYTPTFGIRLPEVREVARLMGPRILGVAVVQINFIVNTIIGLSLPEGSVSSLTLAFTLMLMPQAAIAQSVAIAAMPTFSAQVALEKWDEMRASLSASLRGVLLLAIPAAVGLITLRVPLIRWLYEGGEFTSRSTEMVAWALLWYALGLVFHSLLEIIVRAFYALHDTRTPVTVTAAAMSLNILFSLTFPSYFDRLNWMPHGGLALANSLATFLECSVLLFLLRRRLGGVQGKRLLNGTVSALVGAAVMAVAILFWLQVIPPLSSSLTVLSTVIIGMLVYAAVLWLQRVSELRLLWQSLIRRARRITGTHIG
ncbi:MAG: murein biosynthesis integral membrane protein MurJ [Chloroflexota bacterium]